MFKSSIYRYENKQKEEDDKFKMFEDKINSYMAIETNKGNEIKEMLMKKKREIEYLDEHNRLMYYYPEKIDNLRAEVYAKYRKAEIMESLIKESFTLLQAKIDEQENKLENVDEMWAIVEDKVDDLLSKEKQFYKQHKHGNL